MRARIHRGTQEIGGTCIELEASGRHIALDVGLPLDAGEDGQVSTVAAEHSLRPSDLAAGTEGQQQEETQGGPEGQPASFGSATRPHRIYG